MENADRVRGPIFSVVHAIESWAEKIPDAKALVMPSTGKATTYKELNESVNRVANGLKGLGVMEGDRVAISLANCAEYPQIFYGIIKCRAIAVPLDARLKSAEAQLIIDDCEPKHIFVKQRMLPIYQEIRDKVGKLEEIILIGDEQVAGTLPYNDFMKYSSGLLAAPWFASNDVCEIMYTSGTTGRPKGVMQSHMGLYQNKMNMVLDWSLTQADRMYTVAPLYFAAAQGAAMDLAFVSGATLYLGEDGRAPRMPCR